MWQGGKDGKGNLTTQTNVLSNTPYNFISRFGDGPLTNPEELIAAAHAGCFTMKLSINLENAGFVPEKLETKCEISIENGTITTSFLTLKATVNGISKEKFDEAVNDAEKNCPVSRLLNAQIQVDATLNQ